MGAASTLHAAVRRAGSLDDQFKPEEGSDEDESWAAPVVENDIDVDDLVLDALAAESSAEATAAARAVGSAALAARSSHVAL